MRMSVALLPAGVLVAAAAAAPARTASRPSEERPPRRQRRRPPADDPSLPRVLLIGDSISIGYTPAVRELLKGRANVHRIPGNAQDTATGLRRLDAWLGDGRWDVIHFNWGLWDLCYRHPDSKVQGHRDKARGTLTTPLDRYEKNLAELVRRLRRTGAKLIWASTTPVPPDEAGRFEGDELKYNAVARKIMTAAGVTINDLHAHLAPRFAQFAVARGNVHLTPAGYRFLAEKVAASILEALGPKGAPSTRPGPDAPGGGPAGKPGGTTEKGKGTTR